MKGKRLAMSIGPVRAGLAWWRLAQEAPNHLNTGDGLFVLYLDSHL